MYDAIIFQAPTEKGKGILVTHLKKYRRTLLKSYNSLKKIWKTQPKRWKSLKKNRKTNPNR